MDYIVGDYVFGVVDDVCFVFFDVQYVVDVQFGVYVCYDCDVFVWWYWQWVFEIVCVVYVVGQVVVGNCYVGFFGYCGVDFVIQIDVVVNFNNWLFSFYVLELV